MQYSSTLPPKESINETLNADWDPEDLVRSIFSTLANKDAFEIFKLAEKGIDASTDILRQGQFSKKRYYVRLGELLKLGLVTKDHGRYIQTSLGRLVQDTTMHLEKSYSKVDGSFSR